MGGWNNVYDWRKTRRGVISVKAEKDVSQGKKEEVPDVIV